jgi:hypothetical protein
VSTALGNLHDNVEGLGKVLGENIETSARDGLGYYELKQHTLWLDEECSNLLQQRKQAKLQWLQNTRKINEVNLSNVRHEIV